ncbi:nucleotide sugar dehydrogenase [Candidatus Peregrinibacteria bacterium]|nr:nucleotide sugar dehydrogenase [Candidatus Peregrinibacteria bacterium]
MKIAVIGTGYVGLTTGTCFAEMKHEVLCVDIDQKKIKNLKKGIIPIYEPGLEELVKKNHDSGRLNFTTDAKKAIDFAELVFSAVGTPQDKDHRADLQFVKEVAGTFGKYINSYKIFVNKSTVPVGTGDICEKIIRKHISDRSLTLDFDIVSNPEFLREGNAINDTLNPDRIVIGTKTSRAKEKMEELYRTATKNSPTIVSTNIRTAEIIKYASNAMLATRISFINELANFCEKCGGNIETVSKGIGLDKRIGPRFLNAGIGYGGSCLPKDVKALIQTGRDYDFDFHVIKSADEINEKQKSILFQKLITTLGPLEEKTIAIWGLSFKQNTDDMREAPSLTIIKKLQTEGAHIKAFDPAAIETAQKTIESFNITYTNTPEEAAKNTDALLILTDWEIFKKVDLKNLHKLMKNPLILDGRNIFTSEKVEKAGFTYLCIGRQNLKHTSKPKNRHYKNKTVIH